MENLEEEKEKAMVRSAPDGSDNHITALKNKAFRIFLWIDIGSAQINLHLVVRTQIWVLLVCWANTKASRANIIPSEHFPLSNPLLKLF